ncbi:iron/zinc/copper transport system substrate-binding protein [Salsuginibacillus halophilus]|uniref:Iron/zinc/copper transport system substrate-binding protein n=1 Tax=Salsuginibacillus halophilus TaxID=517424 RepID=A0A2P8HAH7_9BACI|nr:zinc ABC transporter substrate-binding protein [Salsuginibacillus halophilus]PSL43227.1 iron/zinc/copper transport system substrate-binding protein [Salsuginibacillus halophilus]
MDKKTLISWMGITVAGGMLLTACGDAEEETTEGAEETEEETEEAETEDPEELDEVDADNLQITTSFSVLGDIVEQIAGDEAEVDFIVPLGEEPEEHEPTPSDFEHVSDSDVFIINGMGLESWLESLMDNVTDTPAVPVSNGVDPIMLEDGETADPHAWLDPANVEIYAENIAEALSKAAPDEAETFEANAEAYIEELEELDAYIQENTDDIPEENRLITNSEDAFVYFGEAYDFDTEGIWELNAHEEGTPQQIARMVDIVQEREVPYLFNETTVSPDYMESVSEDAGVPVFDEPVYTDAHGEEGSGAETYISMMEHNADVFRDALSE